MQPVPYLFFKGHCAEAMQAYARIFGAPEPQIMRTKDAPGGDAGMGGSPEDVKHAALKVGDGWLYASDWSQAQPMAGNSIALSFRTPEESRRIFDALAEGGQIDMPLSKTFWSPAFGSLTDCWGTRWMIDTENPEMAGQATAEAVPA